MPMLGGKKKKRANPKKVKSEKKVTPKKKRKPSKYNLFVKEYMRKHKGEKAAKDLMKDIGKEWSKLKGK